MSHRLNEKGQFVVHNLSELVHISNGESPLGVKFRILCKNGNLNHLNYSKYKVTNPYNLFRFKKASIDNEDGTIVEMCHICEDIFKARMKSRIPLFKD